MGFKPKINTVPAEPEESSILTGNEIYFGQGTGGSDDFYKEICDSMDLESGFCTHSFECPNELYCRVSSGLTQKNGGGRERVD